LAELRVTDKQQIQKLREENHELHKCLAAVARALGQELSTEHRSDIEMLRDFETGMDALKAAREMLAEKVP